jgi:hypothetical protein
LAVCTRFGRSLLGLLVALPARSLLAFERECGLALVPVALAARLLAVRLRLAACLVACVRFFWALLFALLALAAARLANSDCLSRALAN